MYADPQLGICVYMCSLGTFADSTTRKCVDTCPSPYFAVNDTRRCELNCPPYTFASSLNHICVAMCPRDPLLYGDTVDWMCKSNCPLGSYGNPITQQCVYDVTGVSSCPYNYYGNTSNINICVKECITLFADPILKKCKPTCTAPLYTDTSSMRCVTNCPEYPKLFGNNITMECLT